MANNTNETEIEEDDISLFIDELKSDDPSLKLNACEKLDVISQFLGENRTKNELIPYLNHLIEEYDNDENFLGKITEKLIDIKDTYSNIKFEDYINIFNTLFIFEDDQIRNNSLKDFEKFINKFQKRDINYDVLINLILKLGDNNCLPAMLSSCSLFRYIYAFNERNDNIKKIFINLLKSDILVLKRNAMRTLSILIKDGNIGKNDFNMNFESLFESFFNYKNEGILIELITNLLPSIVSIKNKDYIENKILVKLLNINSSINSWRIDYHISEIIIKLLDNFSLNTIKSKIIPKFDELLNHKDIEVKSNTLYNFNFLTNIINKDENIYNNVMEKVNDTNIYVKINYCETLNNISSNFNKIDLKEKVIPNFIKLLKDPKTEIILSVIKNLDNTIRNIDINIFKEFFLEEFNILIKHKNWKIRYEILNLINKLKDKYEINEILFEINMGMRNDLVLCIRNKIVENILSYKNYLDGSIIKRNTELIIKEWVENKNYIFRISALQSFYKLHINENNKEIINKFEKIYNKLKVDKVANVRLNLIKCVEQYKTNKEFFNRILFSIKSDFKNEVDQDVLDALKL